MVNAAELPDPARYRPCIRTARLTEVHPLLTGASGASMWVLAIALLALYGRHDLRFGDMAFMLGESWFIGLGCVGQPMLTLHLLGANPSPRTCERVATGAYTAAALVTILLGVGALHVGVLIGAFVLILPLAFAIQSGNAAQALARRGRDQAAGAAEGEERGWLACALAIGQAHAAHDTKRDALINEAESTAELRYDIQAYEDAIKERHTRRTVIPLRAINGTNGTPREDRENRHA